MSFPWSLLAAWELARITNSGWFPIQSLDRLTGQFAGQPPYFMGKSMVTKTIFNGKIYKKTTIFNG